MNAKEIRQAFFDFFKSKNHTIVSSAPMVVKNDPTLMFINAGMNQFKDIFLENTIPKDLRVANSQKCLRVSGKHNDLDEVGHDTYHHTMFEMLGNWSFGDYFKKEAIAWAWEFLVDVLKLPSDRLYATVFEGFKSENLDFDEEAYSHWSKFLDKDRIIDGSKKDNFWEMGETGPCGPCSEVHIDLRDEKERALIDGKTLVNKDHPLVIEIWNLVFIQYNRKTNGQLELLPKKHVDTGMGFERLCMAVQMKKSNYDTDIFQSIIQEIADMANLKYGENKDADIAMRVVADHLRAIAFSIADGQLPSNNKAGYVIRRILRRAVRYGYTYLNFSEAFIYKLVPVLIEIMGEAFPSLISQKQLITKVLKEEENSFLRTLETGIKLLDQIIVKTQKENNNQVNGKIVFELYDTYGFPLDLTELILKEKSLSLNYQEFEAEMQAQKKRSRDASVLETEDWFVLSDAKNVEFVGYDKMSCDIQITKYRFIKIKSKKMFQLVFNKTPFYAESGGQVGDTGFIENEEEKIKVKNTITENGLVIHLVEKLPNKINSRFTAVVDENRRNLTANNHTATHILHYALRKVLGTHVEQKGSLVNSENLRFDFSHFQKVTDEEISKIEAIANEMVQQNLSIEDFREIPMSKAQELGAMALFGEKYGDFVRVVKFGNSIELCGGTHVKASGQIGIIKITAESAIAAGIRRIEAITSISAEKLINKNFAELKKIKLLFNNPKDIVKNIEKLISENKSLQKQIENYAKEKVKIIKESFLKNIIEINGINVICQKIEIDSAASVKDLAFQLKTKISNLFLVIGAEINGKPSLSVMISENLIKEKDLNAGKIVRELAKEIQGGGGGQAFFATAGGKKLEGIQIALAKAFEMIKNLK